MRASCAALAEQRSAFVDGALSATDRDRLLVHLAGCAGCRSEVADLRAVRELVSRSVVDRAEPASAELSQRLVSIAGARPHAPVWTPRDRRRRASRLRGTVGGMAVGLVVAVTGAVGYVSAPPDLVAIADPSDEAEAEFSSVLNQLPLISDSMSAVVSVDPAGLTAGSTGRGPSEPADGPITATEAQSILRRSADVSGSASYAGDQSFVAYGSTRSFSARVRVVARPGTGTEVSVLDQSGATVTTELLPDSTTLRIPDDDLLSLLERNYALTGYRGAMVAGRSATLLQASRAGVLAARWWVDDLSGVVLWQKTYDNQGGLRMSAGFTSITVGDPDSGPGNAAPRPIGPTATVVRTLSNSVQLAASGWMCERDLAGLSLVKLRTDRADDPTAVHLVYSDGLATVAVFEQRGRLADAPAGSGWDDTLRAHVRHGVSSTATWQSGDRVFTVMTDGSAGQLADAVAALPHQAPLERTTMERIQAGWGKILADMKG